MLGRTLCASSLGGLGAAGVPGALVVDCPVVRRDRKDPEVRSGLSVLTCRAGPRVWTCVGCTEPGSPSELVAGGGPVLTQATSRTVLAAASPGPAPVHRVQVCGVGGALPEGTNRASVSASAL